MSSSRFTLPSSRLASVLVLLVASGCGRTTLRISQDGAVPELDARGALLSGPTQRTPRLRGCGGQLVDAVWTGRRHLFTWLHGTDGIALDVADEDGRSLRSEVHDRDGWVWIDPGVRLSVAHGGVLQVFLHRPDPDDPPRNELVVRRLDLEGNVRSELVVPIDDGQAADPLVASAARGWLIVARRNADGGYYTVRVDDDGTLLSGATLHDVVREQHNTHSDLEPRPGTDTVVAK